MLMPHHGSKTSSTPDFLKAVGAGQAVIPVGYRNRFGHPKDEVVARYEAMGTQLWRTDRDGAVRIALDGNGVACPAGGTNIAATGTAGDTLAAEVTTCNSNSKLCNASGRPACTGWPMHEWGARDNPRVLVCVHGLTRNGRDFDALAEAMSAHYRVICPDVVGRGQSGRLRDPAGYAIPQYVADMVTLIARLNVDSVHWLGTSMGGLIGMALAAQEGTPIHKLVAQRCRAADHQRIAAAHRDLCRHRSGLGHLRRGAGLRQAGQRPVRPADRGAMASPDRNQRRAASGRPLGLPLRSSHRRTVQGRLCRPGNRPVAALRADRLSDAGRARCRNRPADPRYLAADGGLRSAGKLAEIPGVGHAPMFMSDDQIAVVRDFLLSA
jgi:pimeloyl-ACP methyl ester carboxylesterase